MSTAVLRGDTLVARVAVAVSPCKRLLGLAFQARLDPASGLWIKPCVLIHTWGMRFPIDAVFLDADQNVVGILSEVRPWRICRTFRGTRSVLELSGGTVERIGLQVGERLRFLQQLP